jgi:hypothetical protein
LLRDFHHLRHDERSGQAGADWIFAFVKRIRLNRGENIVLREFLSCVDGVVFEDAEFFGFRLDFLQVLLLPDIDGYGDDLGVVFFLEPLDEDGRV